MLAIVEVPEHGLAVLATAGTQGTVRGQSHGVQISSVTDVVGLQLAVGQVPDLHILVPASGDDDEVGVVGWCTHDQDDCGQVSSSRGSTYSVAGCCFCRYSGALHYTSRVQQRQPL